jgi:two-component system chemotaxis response regulator CheY
MILRRENMRVLIVDDELVGRTKMLKIMERFGECESLENGSEAITAFTNAWENWRPFNLITLDVVMPEMDGTEVAVRIREIERAKNVSEENQAKILMVTGHSDKDTVITSIQAGCDDYIVKPFTKEVLIKKLRKLGFNVHRENVNLSRQFQNIF